MWAASTGMANYAQLLVFSNDWKKIKNGTLPRGNVPSIEP